MKKILLTLVLTMSLILAYTNTQAESYKHVIYGMLVQTPSGWACMFAPDETCYEIEIPSIDMSGGWPPINIGTLINIWAPDNNDNNIGIGWTNALFQDTPTPDEPESGLDFLTNEQSSPYYNYTEWLNAITE